VLGNGVEASNKSPLIVVFFTKTKKNFWSLTPKARAGWPKHLALVRATARAEFDVIGTHLC